VPAHAGHSRSFELVFFISAPRPEEVTGEQLSCAGGYPKSFQDLRRPNSWISEEGPCHSGEGQNHHGRK
jgi:hypothetical protein